MTALAAGAFFTFFLDFFFILGLFLNYIEAQDIAVYYNVLFADHQSYLLFFSGVVVFGYLFVFFPSTKIASIIFAVCFAIVNLTQIPKIGMYVGEVVFMQDNQVIDDGKHTYIGKIVYDGRDDIWFYDDEIQRIVQIHKDTIKK